MERNCNHVETPSDILHFLFPGRRTYKSQPEDMKTPEQQSCIGFLVAKMSLQTAVRLSLLTRQQAGSIREISCDTSFFLRLSRKINFVHFYSI